LSLQAVKVIAAAFAAGLLIILGFAFVVAGAPLPIVLSPFALLAALTAAVGRNLRHITRHGWYVPPGDGGSSGPGGNSDPREPNPQLPSGDMIDPDWDGFVSQFWEYVERERELTGA
jgi:hypothetical protein